MELNTYEMDVWNSSRDARLHLQHLDFQANGIYRKTSSISRTKSQNLNVSCIPLQLSSLNPLKPGVKLRMKM